MKNNFILLFKRRVCVFFLLVILISFVTEAQSIENELELRSGGEFSFGPKQMKALSLKFGPELRFDNELVIKETVINLAFDYRLARFLRGELGSRLLCDLNDDTECSFSYKYYLGLRIKENWGRLQATFRFRYTNIADEISDDEKYARFRVGGEYDFRKSPFSSKLSVELFQYMSNNTLYKMRYSWGGTFDLNKHNSIDLIYKFDVYHQKYINKHIVTIVYAYKF